MTENSKSTSAYTIKNSNSVWRKALHYGTIQEVQKGYIWYNNASKSTFSFLDKGSVRLECANIEGRQRIALHIYEGCLFREVSSLNIGDSSAFFIATEDCIVYNFPHSLANDLDFVREHPELIVNLIESLKLKSNSFFSLLVAANEDMWEIVLARYIEKLAKKSNSNTFAPNITQADLALTLGVHRSTVCRAIKELRKDGIIGTFTMHKLEILDREKLKQLAENNL